MGWGSHHDVGIGILDAAGILVRDAFDDETAEMMGGYPPEDEGS